MKYQPLIEQHSCVSVVHARILAEVDEVLVA